MAPIREPTSGRVASMTGKDLSESMLTPEVVARRLQSGPRRYLHFKCKYLCLSSTLRRNLFQIDGIPGVAAAGMGGCQWQVSLPGKEPVVPTFVNAMPDGGPNLPGRLKPRAQPDRRKDGRHLPGGRQRRDHD